ncbi:MAG: hypothetical protein DLD55_04000 [candidate division SR1 bacterium]|nr:MAG: hypothetical protein DLD55_04000 [candidate division SR1 bacterium]
MRKMKSFQELARKTLSQKFQGDRMLGSLALKVVKAFLGIKKKADHLVGEEEITGYLRFQTLFLKTSDQNYKIILFREKQKLLAAINEQFQALGYPQRVEDLRFK